MTQDSGRHFPPEVQLGGQLSAKAGKARRPGESVRGLTGEEADARVHIAWRSPWLIPIRPLWM